MARIKISDLAEDAKVSADEMKAICGGGISIFGGGGASMGGSNCGISIFGGGSKAGFGGSNCGISIFGGGG